MLNDGVGVARGTVFIGDTAGSWFEIRRFRYKKDGEATVQRNDSDLYLVVRIFLLSMLLLSAVRRVELDVRSPPSGKSSRNFYAQFPSKAADRICV